MRLSIQASLKFLKKYFFYFNVDELGQDSFWATVWHFSKILKKFTRHSRSMTLPVCYLLLVVFQNVQEGSSSKDVFTQKIIFEFSHLYHFC